MRPETTPRAWRQLSEHYAKVPRAERRRPLVFVGLDRHHVFRGVPGVATSEFYHYFHSDQETPDTVPWTGLEATTRAYARIIDEVNR